MEWYEIVLGIAVWIIGIWLWTKFVQFRKGKYHNDSWRTRKKKSGQLRPL